MKALHYLQEQGMLGKTADDIAEFFHSEERLDKVMVLPDINFFYYRQESLLNNAL
jgi:hypothetical protein